MGFANIKGLGGNGLLLLISIPNPKIQEKLAFENKKIVLRSHLKEENKDSLKEAREYFANSDYRAAKNLALRANYENPKNPESWEIFTKSLYLEGKKQEAIRHFREIFANTI